MLQKFIYVLYWIVMELLPPIFMLVLVKGILTNDVIDMWQGAILVLIDVGGQLLLKISENKRGLTSPLLFF